MDRYPPIAGRADLQRIEAAGYPAFIRHASVHAALASVAAQQPQRPALACIRSADPAEPPRRWTHAQFVAEVRRAANLFHRLAGGAPARVALLLPAVPAAHFALWGAETAGMAVPINFLLDAAHVAGLVNASGASIVVALAPHPELDIWSRVAGLRAACPGLQHVLAVAAEGGHPARFDGGEAAADFLRLLEGEPGDALRFEPPSTSAAPAAMFHTGGTTGAPKLAQHTQGNQLQVACGAASMYALTERDVILNGFPLFHVAGSFVYGLSMLLAGGEVVLPPLLGLRDAAFMRRYWTFVERHRVTLLAAVPTVMATLMTTDPGVARLDSVRVLLTGGSPLPNELAGAFEQRYGIPVRNILGMTECAGVISIEPFLAPRTNGCCGLPLPFTEVRAVAADGRSCLPGVPGILRVRGPNVGPGYTDAGRNAETFDDGWLITGDIGHIDDQGRIFVTGRSKDVIIRSGHNIDPGMIEESLLAHPAVQMAAAVGAPDEYAGELPVAFVALKPGVPASVDDLMAFAARNIAERAAVPKRITVLPSLPLTAIGKVYKPALRVHATASALQERAQAEGIATTVHVEETPAGMVVRFAGGDDTALGALMEPYALPWSRTLV